MKRKQKVVNKNMDSYKIPSMEILRYRNEFYGLWRRSDDQTIVWMERVQNCIHRCEYPMTITDHLLIDRFICGLNADELKSIQKPNKSWTFKQLLEHFSKKNNDISYIEAASIIEENANQIENITLETVKLEPNEDDCSQKDPLIASKEGTGSFIDKNPTENITEEEVGEASELLKLLLSSNSKTANFQQALSEEVDHEVLSDVMEFECEDYKFSANDVAVTISVPSIDTRIITNTSVVTTDTHNINAASVAATDKTDIDLTINDVGENLSNDSIEEEPIENYQREQLTENDQQKHQSGVTEDSSIIPSASIALTDSSCDDVVEDPSDSSTDGESIKNEHLKAKKTPKQHTCTQCNRSFNRPSKLDLHVKDVHEGIRNHVCDQCGKRYVRRHELKEHVRTHTGERPYKCDKCDVSYGHKSILRKHMNSVHLGLRPHICQICGKGFVNRPYLNEHLSTHSAEKPFVCDRCGKKFRLKSILRTHKNRVHKQKIRSHVCQICDKCFHGAAELKKHSLTHTGVRPYACDQCDKSFAQTGALKTHKNTVHEGIRPFTCSYCDKRFKRPNHLQQHLTIHTGEKRYTCDQCDTSFALGHHLSSHKKSVHQLKA